MTSMLAMKRGTTRRYKYHDEIKKEFGRKIPKFCDFCKKEFMPFKTWNYSMIFINRPHKIAAFFCGKKPGQQSDETCKAKFVQALVKNTFKDINKVKRL